MTAPMSEVVAALKDKGAHEVGVWVTMQGYWLGIHPDSPLKSRYNCQSHPVARWGQPRGGVNVPLKKGDGEQWFPSPEKAGQFWEDWFSEMKSWGITFVKVSLVLEFSFRPKDIGTEWVSNESDRSFVEVRFVVLKLPRSATIKPTTTRSRRRPLRTSSRPCGAGCSQRR